MADDSLVFNAEANLAPAAPAPATAPQGPPPLPNEPDASLIARAAVAEGDPNNAESYRAIGQVIANRAAKSGQSVADVLAEPGQFEAYQNGHIQSVDTNSSEYKAALAATQGVKAGDSPNDSFFNPKIVAQRGVKPPFDPAKGTMIGSQLFGTGYATNMATLNPAEQAAWDAVGGPAQAQVVPPGGSSQGAAPIGASNALKFLDLHGIRQQGDPIGSRLNPALQKGDTVPAEQGSWYITPQGQIKQTGDPTPDYLPLYREAVMKQGGGLAQLAGGLVQGIGPDIARGANRLAPGLAFGGGNPMYGALAQAQGGPSALELGQAAEKGFAQQARAYDIANIGSKEAQTGRFVGQAIPATAAAAAVPELEVPSALRGVPLIGAGVKAATNALRGVASATTNVGVNPTPVSQQLATGAALGVAVPAALGAAGRVGSAIGDTVRGIVEPLTETGRGNIADRLIAARAAGSNITNPDLTEYVPGSTPTTAEALGNTGLAIAQRSITNDPRFTELGRANAAARDAVVSALKGDPAQREALVADRDAQTAPLLRQAFANPQPTDPTPVVQKIDQILAGKAGQRDAVAQPLQEVRSKLVNSDGSMQTDPEQLWGIRQDIDDRLSPLARGTARSAQAAASQLMEVKQALDPVIEQGAPGFQKYVQNFADLSRPINEHDFLQGLNLTTPTGQVTAGQVGSALKTVARMQAAGGVNGAKALSPDTVQTLQNLQADLARQGNNQLGRGQGSDTVQKAVENMASGTAALHPLLSVAGMHLGPLGSAAAALGNGFYMGQRNKILNAYADRLLNPELGMAALQPRSPGTAGSALQGVGAVAKKVEIPLSALMGVRLSNPSPVGANAQ